MKSKLQSIATVSSSIFISLTFIGQLDQSIAAQDLAQSDKTQLEQVELPPAEDLLDKHVASTGGKDALEKVKSKVLVGTMANDIGGHTFEVKHTVTWLSPNKQHSVFDHPMNLVRVTNGEKAWKWRAGNQHSGDAGKTDWLSKRDTARLVETAESHGEVEWRSKFKSVKTKGSVEVNGKLAYEVEVTTHDDKTYSRFFDKESGRLVKTTRVINSDSLGEYKLESVRDKYEKFGDVWIATKTTHTLHTKKYGVGTQTYEYSSVKLNGEIAESLFEVPEELGEEE